MADAEKARTIALVNLAWQHRFIDEALRADLNRLFETQQFIMGEPVGRLERELAAYCGAEHAVACGSGSDALYLALVAAGIGAGDEVLTTPYTFFATAGAIDRAGARPVFCDVEESSYHIDQDRAAALLAERPGIRAVIPVHLFGACAPFERLREACAARGVTLIEDAAQAIGARVAAKPAGSFGAMACYSFFPTKNLGAYGEAGMVTTNDAGLAGQLRMLRMHGSRVRYVHERVGINSRMDTMQALVLLHKLPYLEEWNERRRGNAALYRELLAGAPVRLPAAEGEGDRHVFHHFVITCERRDRLREYLLAHGVGCEVYYPIPLHLQECFAGLGYKRGDFPVAERLAGASLAIPVGPWLERDEVAAVARRIGEFYRTASSG